MDTGNLIPEIPIRDLTLTLSNYSKSFTTYNLKELERSKNKEFSRKRYYIFTKDNKNKIFITCTKNKKVYRNTEKFYNEFPLISSKPLFLLSHNEYYLIGQEFFEGKSLKGLLDKNLISKRKYLNLILNLKSKLDYTLKNSSFTFLKRELEEFIEFTLNNSYFTDFEKFILNNYVFVILKNQLSLISPKTRITSGDISPENILIDKNNRICIIDCEFLKRTHFYKEDWIRLSIFGKGLKHNELFESFITKEEKKFYYLYFYINQTNLNRLTLDDHKYINTLKFDFLNILQYSCSINSNLQEIKLFSSSLNTLCNYRNLYSEKQNQLDTIIKRTKSLNETNKKLLKRIDELENILNIRDDKINRLINSFSWKSTSFLRFLRRNIFDKLSSPVSSSSLTKDRYNIWINKYDTLNFNKYVKLRKINKSLSYRPFLSVVMPVYNPKKKFLTDAIDSLLGQIYTHWELCIVDDFSTEGYVRNILEYYSKKYQNIKVLFNQKNLHISKTTNKAIKMSSGSYIVFFDHDDLLRPHSLLRLAQEISLNKSLKLLYTDEDKIDNNLIRSQPYFKPDWNPDLLLSQNYISHLLCVKKELVENVGSLRVGFEGSQDWDLALRLSEKIDANEVFHIPEILYHWRIHSRSVSHNVKNKDYAISSAIKAVKQYIVRNNINGNIDLIANQYIQLNRIIGKRSTNFVSIIIPTKDNFELLKLCIDSLLKKTHSFNYEILLVNNQSSCINTLEYLREIQQLRNIRVLHYNKTFNYSAINNYASKYAIGNILLFLNDDTEALSENWIEEIVVQTIRNDIGAVGVKLLYPSGSIQHAGVILGLGGIAGEALKGFPYSHPGQMQRANLIQNISAVTGAFLAIEKNKFNQVNGFDEEDLKISFNDVDLCLKLLKSGYRNLYTPKVVFRHHESASRMPDHTPSRIDSFKKEIKFMKKKWGEYINNDPNYNKNLSLDCKFQFDAKL